MARFLLPRRMMTEERVKEIQRNYRVIRETPEGLEYEQKDTVSESYLPVEGSLHDLSEG